MKPRMNTDKNCHCERPKGARQSHTNCHPEFISGSQMLKQVGYRHASHQHDKQRNFYE